ncbi:cadherin-like domain-containing protein, partial [bacterium]|nr:cadherin-like domain-containing protein [bacterium]
RNHDPEAKSIHVVAIAGQPIEIDPLLVDDDIDGQALSVGLLTAPLGGEFAVIDHRRIRFTPDTDFIGQDVVQYEVDDGNGGFAVGFITIEVIPAGVADIQDLQVTEGSEATNSGTIPAIPGAVPTLTASVGDVVLTGGNTWFWYWQTADGPVDSQPITITAHYDDGTTSTVSFDLLVKNAPPTILSLVTSSPLVNPVMPFNAVTISGSFIDPSLSDTHQAVINWGDGTTSIAVIDPLLRTFTGDHVYSDQGEFDVVVTLTDDEGEAASASVITKIGEKPQLLVAGAAQAIRFQNESFTLTTANVTPSIGDQYGFIFDWNDDGQFDQLVVGPNGTTISHAFTQLGWTTFRAAVITKGGVFLDEHSISIDVVAVALMTNSETGLEDLVFSGTEGDDSYSFTQIDATTISVTTHKENGTDVNTTPVIYSGVTGGLHVYTGSGNDKIDATGLTTKDATLFGGDGSDTVWGGAHDDTIYADGAEGTSADVVVGGSGDDTIVSDGAEGVGDQIEGNDGNDLILAGGSNDTISGGVGNDVIIAGAGADFVNGDADSDMIIAGKTRGIDLVSWQLVQAEWTSGRPLANRVGHILGTDNTPRANGSVVFNSQNALDDHSIDVILGGADEDWLIVDDANDVTPDDDVLSDILTDIT